MTTRQNVPRPPVPFRLAVPDDVLDELRERLTRTCWPDVAAFFRALRET